VEKTKNVTSLAIFHLNVAYISFFFFFGTAAGPETCALSLTTPHFPFLWRCGLAPASNKEPRGRSITPTPSGMGGGNWVQEAELVA